MTTEGYSGVIIPQWFKDKYPSFMYGSQYDKGDSPDVFPICLRGESKFYRQFSEDERFLDIQKVLKENVPSISDVTVVLLHECGGITRIKITLDSITAKEPTSWKDVTQVEHDYCYGCSD